MSRIALLQPSRGILASEMAEAVDRELSGYWHVRFYTHDLPIPDCFNSLGNLFLESGAELAWFVEEDVIPPQGSLEKLLALDTDIAFVDYPLVKFPTKQCFFELNGRVVWVGLGCTLIRRRVFEALSDPWFESGHSLVGHHSGSASNGWVYNLRPDPRIKYGGQDVYFCSRAVAEGFDIGVVDGLVCQHLPMPLERVA